MNKFFKNLTLSFFICTGLALSGCVSNNDGSPENGKSDQDAVQSYGMSQNQNFADFSSDFAQGPQDGLLGQRHFYFEFNSDAVDEKDNETLSAHADYLKEHPSAHVVLEGNTDARGSRAYNLALGERRAQAVLKILKADGVNADQMRTLSYGKERPWALGQTEADYAKNRRVDIVYESD